MTLAELVVTAAAVVGALGVLWRALRLGELLRDTRRLASLAQLQESFLSDWNGEPARDGRAAIPSVPARLSSVERRAADLGHTVRGDVTSRLVLLGQQQDGLVETTRENARRLAEVEARLLDHRRRNEQQIEVLREAISDIQRRSQRVRRDDYENNGSE